MITHNSLEMPQFILIYGYDLEHAFVEAVKIELNARAIHSNDLVKEDCRGHVVVLIAHSSINIEVDGSVSYISNDEMTIETVLYLRDNAAAFWFAGCCAGNIDVTYADVTYHAVPVRRVHPFGSMGYHESSVMYVSTHWFYAFLQTCRYHGIDWWAYEDNFHFDLQQQTRGERINCTKLLEDVQQWVACMKVRFSNTILYPYRISFPEVVHFAVFRAVYPQVEFLFVDNPPELHKKKSAYKLRLMDIAKDGNDNWLNKICGLHLLQTVPCEFQDATRCFREGHGAELSEFLVSHLRTFNPQCFTAIRSKLLERLMLTGTTAPLDSVSRVAIVCRTSTHSQGDMRMKVTSVLFQQTVMRVCVAAALKGWGVVLMDGYSSNILTIMQENNNQWTNLADHHIDSNGRKLGIVPQMQLLQKWVQMFNIQAAVGIHGGFLDVLAILGVSPRKTIRMCSDDSTRFRKIKWHDWQSRTENMHILFHAAENCNWLDFRAPNDVEIASLFL